MEFVVVADHPPQLCPSSNAMARKAMKEGGAKLPTLAKSLGVEIVYSGVPLVDHKLFFVLKAATIEAARTFIVKSGIIQTNTAHIYPTVSIADALKVVEELAPIS